VLEGGKLAADLTVDRSADGAVPTEKAAALKTRLLALLGVSESFDDVLPRPPREFHRPPVGSAGA
jgi:hypothetical protein